MAKTIVLIGAFSGELNSIRHALANINADFRFISFLHHDDAMKMLMKDHILIPDILIIDETAPVENAALKTTGGEMEGITLILFTRKDFPAMKDHSRRVYSFPKSQLKADYANFLSAILAPGIDD